MSPKALLIEDNAPFRKTLAETLSMNGFEVREADSGKRGLTQAESEQPDLIILDLMLPGMSGLEVCQRVKQAPGTAAIPILVLTGSDQEGQDIACLDMGADDYLAKPVKTERLLAHCRALLRRSGRRSDQGKLRVGDLELDPSTKTIVLDGQTHSHLTPKEFALLYELALHSPESRDRESLYRKVWETDPPSLGSLRTIDVHVRRIRLKLRWKSDAWLQGVHGRGYSLVPPSQS